MNKKITFRHMDHVPDVDNYANGALERIVDALSNERSPVTIELVLSPGRPHAHHEVELLVKSPNYHIICKEEGPHFFQLIDKACDVVYRKIHERKKQLLDERKHADSYKGA
jgi:ribosome-associated translation inhibitor RaiA